MGKLNKEKDLFGKHPKKFVEQHVLSDEKRDFTTKDFVKPTDSYRKKRCKMLIKRLIDSLDKREVFGLTKSPISETRYLQYKGYQLRISDHSRQDGNEKSDQISIIVRYNSDLKELKDNLEKQVQLCIRNKIESKKEAHIFYHFKF